MYRTIFSALLGFLLTAQVLPAQTSAPVQTPAQVVAAANNVFAGELYQCLKGGTGNIFFSPYSISSALTMTYQGAKRATAEEMAKVLHLPTEGRAVNDGYAALNQALHGTVKDKGFELSLANALWGQTGEPFLPAFTENLKSNYGAGLEELDFKTAPEPSRLKINAWVANQTQDRIKDLLPPGSIDPATRLVLTNAIFFKAEWAKKFTKSLTQEGDFRTFGSPDIVKAWLMHKQDRFRYAEDEKCQALEMDYARGELAMVVLMPKPAVDPQRNADRRADIDPLKAGQRALEEAFSGEYVLGLMGKLAPHTVKVTLPKWKTTQAFDLSNTLKQMGMKRAFIWKEADFTGMANNPDWYISLVIHKAFVDVNEDGTEAAAATAVVMRAGSARPDPSQTVEFRADRPFLYVIVHKASGAILFAGRVADPTKSE